MFLDELERLAALYELWVDKEGVLQAVLKMNKGLSIMCLMLFLLVVVADSAGATYIVSEYERGELAIAI